MGLAARYTRAALQDLQRIYKHVRAENPAAAERVRLAILKTVEMLENFPYLGKRGRKRSTREKTIPKLPYLIVYRVDADEIVLLRIYHGARKRT